MNLYRMSFLSLCCTTFLTWMSGADVSAASRLASPNIVQSAPLLHHSTSAVRRNGVQFHVLATYTAGTLQGLIGANGNFYALAYDGPQMYADLLKITPQGSITQHAVSLLGRLGLAQPTIFVNNTLYGVGYSCITKQACIYAIGDGQLRDVYDFVEGNPLDTNPSSPLAYANGTFYGATESYGQFGAGAIYSLTPNGSGTLLHTNQGYSVFSCGPPSIVKVSGTLYGVARLGGPNAAGIFYSINLTNDSFTLLHSFGGRYDASQPCGLVFANGLLYGISLSGDHNNGTLFTISYGGFSSVLHVFSDQDANPLGLIEADGKLFGTSFGMQDQTGSAGGAVWEYSNLGYRELQTFPVTFHEGPTASLVYVNGTLYGVTAHEVFAITGV